MYFCLAFTVFRYFLFTCYFITSNICQYYSAVPCFMQVKNIAGYAVGEYVGDLSDEDTDGEEELTENPDFYEIVTAWVHHE